MSTIRWLDASHAVDAFPPAEQALLEPNGLLAAGGDLKPARLLAAYRRGIFPWYEEGQPILWWSPHPRAVLFPDELRVSRSLKRVLKRRVFEVTADTAFDRVIRACAAPRRYTDATWITREMGEAYRRLHRLGHAHSFEAWRGGELVGGLYGIAIGRAFFGESMFAHETDASKAAFVPAVRYLAARGFELIDCQVTTDHLVSLGAREISRAEFLGHIEAACAGDDLPGPWTGDFAE